MNLSVIERLVLNNIKYDAYSSLSIDTDAQKMLDFATLHDCVFMAREEIKLNCYIPALLKHATRFATVSGTKIYTIADTDFDLPIKVRYITSDNEIELIRKTYENILSFVEKTSTQGTPTYYIMFGSDSTGLSKIELFPTPDTTSQYVDIDYKPTLALLITSTNEDLVMRKYPMTVVKLASAYAFQFIKNDNANFATWLKLGYMDFKEINLREIGSDYKPNNFSENLIKLKRSQRFTR